MTPVSPPQLRGGDSPAVRPGSLLAELQPRGVAVLRALQLGDLLCAVPALRALRAAAPGAQVTLIGLPWAGELVARLPAYLDELVVLPGFPGLPEQAADPAAVPPFVERMRARGFDLALQLHGSGLLTNPIVALLGAREMAGTWVPGTWRPGEHFMPHSFEASEIGRHLDLLSWLGATERDERPELTLLPRDRERFRRLSTERHLEPGPFAVLHPGASDPRRRWPAQRFAAVGDALAGLGLQVVVSGAAGDSEAAAAVLAAMRAPALSLVGATDLGAFAAMLEASRLVVTNDTGASHLAAAVGTPSVVVFVHSDPARWAPADSRWHRAMGVPHGWDAEQRGGHCCLGDACAALPGAYPEPIPAGPVVDEAARLLAVTEPTTTETSRA